MARNGNCIYTEREREKIWREPTIFLAIRSVIIAAFEYSKCLGFSAFCKYNNNILLFLLLIQWILLVLLFFVLFSVYYNKCWKLEKIHLLWDMFSFFCWCCCWRETNEWLWMYLDVCVCLCDWMEIGERWKWKEPTTTWKILIKKSFRFWRVYTTDKCWMIFRDSKHFCIVMAQIFKLILPIFVLSRERRDATGKKEGNVENKYHAMDSPTTTKLNRTEHVSFKRVDDKKKRRCEYNVVYTHKQFKHGILKEEREKKVWDGMRRECNRYENILVEKTSRYYGQNGNHFSTWLLKMLFSSGKASNRRRRKKNSHREKGTTK